MDIDIIKQKFRKLIELNPDGDYGIINGPLEIQEIEAFEKKHKVSLPPDYRQFINKLYNGGFGEYQIMPLEWWDSVHNAFYIEGMGNKLSEPFLLTDNWKESYDDDSNDDDDYNAIVNGTIRLCHMGCGNFLFLVVNGEEYGNIWIDDRASNGEIVPLRNNSSSITFKDWYCNWLDKEIIKHEEANQRR